MSDRSALTVTIHAVDQGDTAALATIHAVFEDFGLGEWGGPLVENPNYDPSRTAHGSYSYPYMAPDSPNGEEFALGYDYGVSEATLDSAETVASILADHPSIVAECQQDPRYEFAGYTVLVVNGETREISSESEGSQYVALSDLEAIITDGVLDYAAYRRLTGADFRDAITAATPTKGEPIRWLRRPTPDEIEDARPESGEGTATIGATRN